MDMEKKDLKKLTKKQLIKLLMNQKKKPRTGKWKPIPREIVNEDIILPPPEQFRDRSPKPTRKPLPPPIPQVEEKKHITNVTSFKIKELNQALKGHAESYGIELQDNLNLLNHFTKTKALVESHLESLLKDMKGFKIIETLEVKLEKETID